MRYYELKGTPESELKDYTIGRFTTEMLAVTAREMLPESIRKNTKVVESDFELNTININGEKIDLTKRKKREEILKMAEKNNGDVSGYLKFHISEIVGDLDEFRDFLGYDLAGVPVNDLDYSLVSIDDRNNIIFKVIGNIPKDTLDKLKV